MSNSPEHPPRDTDGPAARPALPTQYKPTDHEARIRERWENSGAFHPDPSRVLSGQAKPYAIVIPPPNVTDRLHLGHALNNTLQDILVRAHRMMGFETLWMPGTDHAGIATQTVVEKRVLKETGKKRMEFSREEFVAKIKAFKDEYEATITGQLKAMGCSCDWQRQRFTMDEQCARAVNEAFFRLFRDGLIYRGKRLVNWDPVTQTALADDEVEMEEVDGHFYYLRYPLVGGPTLRGGSSPGPVTWSELRQRGYATPEGPDYADDAQAFVTVATTRPETYLGDTAVGINPRDPRAVALRGLSVELPLVGRVIPIIEDDYVVLPKSMAEALGDPEAAADPKADFATGFLKVTPAHDPNDYELGQRHNLAIINVMAPDASISDKHGWSDIGDAHIFIGKSREEARKLVVKEFQARSLVESIKPYRHSVGHSYRSHAAIEPYLSDQWYVKVTDPSLAGAALRSLAAEQRTIKPENCGAGVPPAAAAPAAANQLPPTVNPKTGNSKVLDKRHRRLPHWERGGTTYAIDFRTAGIQLSEPERQLVLDAAVHWHGKRLTLFAATVMPDHVHLLLRPEEKSPGEWWPLSELLHSIKSFTAHEISKQRGTSGQIWQDESYDHIIRSISDFERQYGYIQDNPVKAGLADKPGHYPFSIIKPELDELRAELAAAEATDEGRQGGPGRRDARPTVSPADGDLRFHPDRYAKMYESWNENIRDWCISRQLWWGHQIPVWKLPSLTEFTTAAAKEHGALAGRVFSLVQSLERSGRAFGVRFGIKIDEEKFAKAESLRLQGSSDFRDAFHEALKASQPIASEGTGYFVCIKNPADDREAVAQLEAMGLVRDPDVLDTWFSSALWPISTMGWPQETDLLKAFNPTDTLCTAREIITLWVSRMVMFNRYFRGQDLGQGPGRGPLPFRDVFIHCVVQDGEGRKMSKSLGNGVDPLDIIASHGTDAMRFTIAQMATHTQDVRLPVVRDPASGKNTSPKFDAGRNFCNKLWNAARFAITILESNGARSVSDGSETRPTHATLSLPDRWMLSRLRSALESIEQSLTSFSFADYAQTTYDLLWRDFCDWYLEAIKPTVATNPSQRAVLAHALESIVRLLHPIAPFITEAIWERLSETCGAGVPPASSIPGIQLTPARKPGLLATAGWPQISHSLRDEAAERDFENLRGLITAIREVRAQHNVLPRRRITLHAAKPFPPDHESLIKTLAVVETITTNRTTAPTVPFIYDAWEYRLSNLTEAVDPAAEAARLDKVVSDCDREIEMCRKRLDSPGYTEKAPPKMVEQTRDQLAKAEAKRAAAIAALKRLKGEA